MDEKKRAKLAANGWVTTTVEEFLELTPEQMQYIELKMQLAKLLKERRQQKRMSQTTLAEHIQSSQSRVAKMENGDPTVTIDLLVRSLFALDVDKEELGQLIAS